MINYEHFHLSGECYFDPKNPSKVGVCQCRDWYVGDGIHHCGPPVKNGNFYRKNQNKIGINLETIMQTLPTLSPSKTVCRSDVLYQIIRNNKVIVSCRMNVWRTLNANLTHNQGIFDFFLSSNEWF